MARFEILHPRIEDGVPLSRAAHDAGVALRTAQRWLLRYRAWGLAGLARTPRTSVRRTDPELVGLIEALALGKPRRSLASITRRVADVAAQQGWAPVSYGTVRGIVAAMDAATLTLAHDGAVALRDNYELVYWRQAEHPNAMWQVDHTQLDILVLHAEKPVRPWLTVVLDDHSRAVPGYTVGLGAP